MKKRYDFKRELSIRYSIQKPMQTPMLINVLEKRMRVARPNAVTAQRKEDILSSLLRGYGH